MPDDPEYFDEPARTVGPRTTRPEFRELEERLRAEGRESARQADEARASGRYQAAIRRLYEHPSGEVWAVVDRFGFGRLGWDTVAMPRQRAEQTVQLINDSRRFLEAFVDAYIENDEKRAMDSVRKLFGAIRTARRGGRPHEPYKKDVMARVLAGLERCSRPPRQAAVKRAIEKAAMDLGQSPSDGTLTNWAREALELDTKRRAEKEQ
jgi:hypothetical protein